MEDTQNRSQEKYWFKQKTYGYGVTPCSVQGWLITLLLAAVLAGGGYFLFGGSTEPPLVHLFYFFLYVSVFVAIFFQFTKSKTQGKLGWRWGRRARKRV